MRERGSPPTPSPCSDSSLFRPCGSSFGAPEQSACGSLAQKRLSHGSKTPVPRSSTQPSPKRHNTDRTQRWPREYQRAALTLENGYYGRVASDDLLNHAIPTLRKRICSPATDKINISCFQGTGQKKIKSCFFFQSSCFQTSCSCVYYYSPEVNVLLYSHPTQLLVGREGSGRNRLNPVLLQTSEERRNETTS